MSSSKELERRVADLVRKLPPMPETIGRLLEMAVADVPPEREEVVRLVESDPALCTELLHLARSCYARPRRVDSVGEAIDCVGLRALAGMVGTSFAEDAINREFAALGHLPDYFNHSREISATCRLLAHVLGLRGEDGEFYRVAGLVHDIGRLVITIAGGKTGVPLMGMSWEQMTTFVRSEQELLGMNHCDVGMQLCRQWGFAPLLQEGVQRHHTPLKGGDFSYPGALIFLAHFVASSDFTGDILATLVHPPLLKNLGMTRELFDQAKTLYAAREPGPAARA